MTTAILAVPRRSGVSGAALGSGHILILGCVWLLSMTFVWSTGAMWVSTTAAALALISEAQLRRPLRRPAASALARVTRLVAWLVAFAVTAFYCAIVAFVHARR